jgi:hypothetical protein
VDAPKRPVTELIKPRRGMPLWLWMLLRTIAIVAMLIVVGRNSFAA